MHVRVRPSKKRQYTPIIAARANTSSCDWGFNLIFPHFALYLNELSLSCKEMLWPFFNKTSNLTVICAKLKLVKKTSIHFPISLISPLGDKRSSSFEHVSKLNQSFSCKGILCQVLLKLANILVIEKFWISFWYSHIIPKVEGRGQLFIQKNKQKWKLICAKFG